MNSLLLSVALDYYTPSHLLMFTFAPAIFFILFFTLRKKSEKVRFWTLMIVLIANAVLFVSYKLIMAFTYEEFILLNELPLHLCNICAILLPVALKTKNKFLLSYLYFISVIGAFAAVVFFDSYFLGKNAFSYTVLVYFIYHSILCAVTVVFAALRIYTPNFTDIIKAYITLVVFVLIMHVVNSIFRATGACEIANYFYTYGMPENPLLGTLYKLIPVPVLYMLPILPIAGILSLLMCLPFVKYNKKLKLLNSQNLTTPEKITE